MALHYDFIVTLVILYSFRGAIRTDAASQTSSTDVKLALIEKDMEHIKSVLNAVLKQVQTTTALTSKITELQQQANLWKNIAAKQQAMESTLATEIQNVKLKDEKLIQGLNVQVKAMLDKDSILSTKLQVLETQQQQQANTLKDTVTKQQAVKSTQATQDAQIQELKSGLKDVVTKQQVAGSTQAVQIQELKSRDEKQAALIQELKNRDEKLIQGLNVQVKSMIEKDAIFSTKQQVVETQVSKIDNRLSQLEGRPQLPLATEQCSCKEELRWMNSTGVAFYNDVFAKQTDFENRITRQLSQLNQSADECGCMEEVYRLNFTAVALYNDMLTKQSTLERQTSRQLSHLNQTANVCSCQQDLDLLNSTLTNLYYKVMNAAVTNKAEECSCKEELRWMNSTGVAFYNDVFAKQTDFENRIIRQLSQLNKSADECGCMEEVNRLNFTGVSLYNDMLTKQSTLESQTSQQLSHLNQTANECSCQQDLDLLNSTLTNLYYKVMNAAATDKDCAELYERGVKLSGGYKISPSDNQGAFDVYCDMETDGGGWTVFQRRQDGSVDFFRDWNDYKTGFGNLYGEFWLGNDRLHQLTSVNNYTLRVDLEDWSGVKKYATYTQFAIANETDKYRITFGTYSGDAGDSLIYHRGQQFSTKDQDNDESSGVNCATIRSGAWWYKSCIYSNLNGFYYNQKTFIDRAVSWWHFSNSHMALKITEMKIRPTGF